MRSEQAARIVDTVMAAWDWEMEPMTLELWQRAIGGLADAESAELAVVELFASWTRQQGKPKPGDVREAYDAVRRRLERERAEEDRAKLPPPDESKIPEELRLKSVKRGGELVRAVLLDKGIDAPVDAKHAEAYDPPLSIAEQRHHIHVRHKIDVATCRFCQSDEKEVVRNGAA